MATRKGKQEQAPAALDQGADAVAMMEDVRRRVDEMEVLTTLTENTMSLLLPALSRIDPSLFAAKMLPALKTAAEQPETQSPDDWARLATACLLFGARAKGGRPCG